MKTREGIIHVRTEENNALSSRSFRIRNDFGIRKLAYGLTQNKIRVSAQIKSRGNLEN